MTPRMKPLLFSLALAAATTGALAQPAPAPGPDASQADTDRRAHMKEHMREHMRERMARRAAELKAKLKLSPEQELAWKEFTTAMQPAGPAHMPNHAELASLSTPERLDRMRELRRQHEAEFDKRDAATRSFYGTLTAEQKKIFDANTGHPFHEGNRPAGPR